MRRIATVLLLAALVAVSASACHRRRPRDGTCAAHIDCDPGYDCLSGRCRKRAAAPGLTPEAPPPPEPAAPVREAPAPLLETPPVPDTARPVPARPQRNPQPSAPIDNTPTPPPSNLPMWKARLKNS